MTDIVERLRAQVDLDPYIDTPTNRLLDEAAAEIERLRDMCSNREEFIAQHNLWKEFSRYLSEPRTAVTSTERGGPTPSAPGASIPAQRLPE